MMTTAQTFARTLSLALLGMLPASALYGSTPVATLTCQSAQGATMSIPVFQFSLNARSASLSLDVAAMGPLLNAQAVSTSYATCTLDNNAASASMSNVTVTGVSAIGIGQGVASGPLGSILPPPTTSQLYASTGLAFSSLTIGGVTMQASKAGAATNGAKDPAPFTDSALAKLRSAASKAIQAQSLGSR